MLESKLGVEGHLYALHVLGKGNTFSKPQVPVVEHGRQVE